MHHLFRCAATARRSSCRSRRRCWYRRWSVRQHSELTPLFEILSHWRGVAADSALSFAPQCDTLFVRILLLLLFRLLLVLLPLPPSPSPSVVPTRRRAGVCVSVCACACGVLACVCVWVRVHGRIHGGVLAHLCVTRRDHEGEKHCLSLRFCCHSAKDWRLSLWCRHGPRPSRSLTTHLP